jgi:hypothetical protein
MDPNIQREQRYAHNFSNLWQQARSVSVRIFLFQSDFDKTKLDMILQRNKMPFYQVSACTGEGIEDMFFGII